MQKQNKYSLGFRGWMLIIYQATAFFAFTIFTSWPTNILASRFGGTTKLTTIYTIGCLLGIAIQLIMSRYIGRIKNVMTIGIIFAGVSMLFALGLMLVPESLQVLWQICYFVECVMVTTWCTFLIGIVVGQWFPRRKGTVMGIATFAFPLTNALLTNFSAHVNSQGIFLAYLPYFIGCIVGIMIGVIFIKDYPEKCGCFRDNDKSITPEVAKAMMEAEIKAKETSVWKLGNVLKTRDFWFLVLPEGFLLMSSVGLMKTLVPMLASYGNPLMSKFGLSPIMLSIAFIACFGSWLLGVIDTKLGTKKAIIIAVVLMLISGVCGMFPAVVPLAIAMVTLAIYQGAASNFTVSGAARYWRREDFANVFAVVNPTSNIIQAVGPMLIAVVATSVISYRASFILITCLAVVSLIMILCFSPKHVNDVDAKLREEAGKPLDDELLKRMEK